MYRFLATNEESLRDVRLHANVAVVVSLRQYLADELSFAFSASRVLADNGIAHVMLTEDDLSSASNRPIRHGGRPISSADEFGKSASPGAVMPKPVAHYSFWVPVETKISMASINARLLWRNHSNT